MGKATERVLAMLPTSPDETVEAAQLVARGVMARGNLHQCLTRLVRAGKIERVAPGVYRRVKVTK